MGKYHFNDIERKWQKFWAKTKPLKPTTTVHSQVLRAGHVSLPFWGGLRGASIGYIASDIYAVQTPQRV